MSSRTQLSLGHRRPCLNYAQSFAQSSLWRLAGYFECAATFQASKDSVIGLAVDRQFGKVASKLIDCASGILCRGTQKDISLPTAAHPGLHLSCTVDTQTDISE